MHVNIPDDTTLGKSRPNMPAARRSHRPKRRPSTWRQLPGRRPAHSQSVSAWLGSVESDHAFVARLAGSTGNQSQCLTKRDREGRRIGNRCCVRARSPEVASLSRLFVQKYGSRCSLNVSRAVGYEFDIACHNAKHAGLGDRARRAIMWFSRSGNCTPRRSRPTAHRIRRPSRPRVPRSIGGGSKSCELYFWLLFCEWIFMRWQALNCRDRNTLRFRIGVRLCPNYVWQSWYVG